MRIILSDFMSLDWNNTMLLPGDDAIGAIRELRARDGQGGIQVWGRAATD